MQKGVGDGCQVRLDLVTRAECIKVSRGTGIPKRTVTHISCHCLVVFLETGFLG